MNAEVYFVVEKRLLYLFDEHPFGSYSGEGYILASVACGLNGVDDDFEGRIEGLELANDDIGLRAR
jgi:hypothetical protein